MVSIGRGRHLKGDMSSRVGLIFQVLVEDIEGQERLITADAVVDASGSFGHRNWLGPGGLPALGERKVFTEIESAIPNTNKEASKYQNKCTLVVGSGYSAITTINQIKAIAESTPDSSKPTKVVWVTRQGGEVYDRIEGDPLPQRDALSLFGNSLGTTSSSEDVGFQVDRYASTSVLSIKKSDGGQFTVTLEPNAGSGASGEGKSVVVQVDNVVANVGYRPDTSIYQELQVHQCYATEGPMRLAAALLASKGGGGDCLQQVAPGPATLVSPEPNFFIIGIKSYGRGSAFLLQIGHAQLKMVAGMLSDSLKEKN